MNNRKLPPNTLAEIFGHAPADRSRDARMLWDTGMCPFTSTTCGKINHNSGLVYGTCSAKTGERTVIICPNRLYANKYNCIREVAEETFGGRRMLMFNEYWEKRHRLASEDVVVETGGVKVYIDPTSAPQIDGVTVDFVESMEGSGFKFTNPNAKNPCSCGKSFSA